MNSETRVVIIGCGRIAGGYNDRGGAVVTHAAAYRKLGALLVGCCDIDGRQADRFARRWQIEVSGNDPGTVLQRTEPRVVSVCTPPEGRATILEAVLATKSVRAVLMEKPIAAKTSEAERVRDLARVAGRPVLVNYSRAFDPFYRKLGREYEDGTFGGFCGGTVRYYGSAVGNASHMLERVLAMFGPPFAVRRLSGGPVGPVFELSVADARIVFLPTEGCRYSPIEIDLLFETRRVRVIDSECRVELFQSQADPNYEGFSNLVREPGWAETPSPESILHAVDETLRAAAGEPVAGGLLDRAVLVTRILEDLGAVA